MEQNNFELPEFILNQLNECAGGGFLLFILDEQGAPNVYFISDTIGVQSQIQNFAIDWLAAHRKVQLREIEDRLSFDLGVDPSDEED
jgi:hypothetical protein